MNLKTVGFYRRFFYVRKAAAANPWEFIKKREFRLRNEADRLDEEV